MQSINKQMVTNIKETCNIGGKQFHCFSAFFKQKPRCRNETSANKTDKQIPPLRLGICKDFHFLYAALQQKSQICDYGFSHSFIKRRQFFVHYHKKDVGYMVRFNAESRVIIFCEWSTSICLSSH
jgi:hypothetical protein